MPTTEPLAPAGAFDALQATVAAGADAIYFGIEQLNMRARSANKFTLADLPEVSRRCRESGVSSYITLNTVLYDHDLLLMRCIVDAAPKHRGISKTNGKSYMRKSRQQGNYFLKELPWLEYGANRQTAESYPVRSIRVKEVGVSLYTV